MALSGSTFLNIPTELRLQILHNLLPEDGNLNVDFCAVKTATRQDFGNKHKRSPIASFLSDHSAVSEFAQQYGLHLAAVCRQLRAEYVPLVANLTRLAPHCPGCLDKILSHLVKDLDIELPLLYHICYTAKFPPSYRFPRSQIGPTDGLLILSNMFTDLRRVVGKHYGRYDLLDDNDAHIGKRQRWLLKRVTTQRKIIEFDEETHAPHYEDKEIVKEKCFASINGLNDDDFRPNSDWELAVIHKNSAYLQEWYVLGELGL